MVLMCLCDYANDEGGNCWPSVATISRRCSKGERTVQGAIQWLKTNGYLTLIDVPGKSHRFHLDPRKICAPAETAPPQKKTKTPAKSAPNPPRTANEGFTSVKPMRAKGWPVIPDWMPAEPWNGFVQMRKRKGGNPTPRAVGLLIGKLERWRTQGHDPGSILDASTENNWTGLFEPKGSQNGQPQRSKPDNRNGIALALDRRLGLGEPAGEAGRYPDGGGQEDRGRPLALAAPLR